MTMIRNMLNEDWKETYVNMARTLNQDPIVLLRGMLNTIHAMHKKYV